MNMRLWWESQKEIGLWEDVDAGGRIILKCILDKMGWYGLDSSVSGQEPVEGCCEHGNEPSGSVKCWEILEWLRD
jgi:hypothetical protein